MLESRRLRSWSPNTKAKLDPCIRPSCCTNPIDKFWRFFKEMILLMNLVLYSLFTHTHMRSAQIYQKIWNSKQTKKYFQIVWIWCVLNKNHLFFSSSKISLFWFYFCLGRGWYHHFYVVYAIWNDRKNSNHHRSLTNWSEFG